VRVDKVPDTRFLEAIAVLFTSMGPVLRLFQFFKLGEALGGRAVVLSASIEREGGRALFNIDLFSTLFPFSFHSLHLGLWSFRHLSVWSPGLSFFVS
jgi:hypothetical protein